MLRFIMRRVLARNYSNARLAIEFHGLQIPSRQELQSQQSDSAATNPPTCFSTTTRLDPTIEQRRAARLAREDAMAADTRQKTDDAHAHAGPYNPRHNTSRGNEKTRVNPRYQTTARLRMAPNKNRFQGPDLDVLGQSTPFTSAKSAVRRKELRKDSSNAFRRGRPGDRMAPSTTIKSSIVPRSEIVNETQEPSIGSLENGGEEPMKARLTAPENPSVDLSDILGRIRSTIGVAPRDSAPVLTPVKDRSQYIMEVIGGDYARYSPHLTQDYLTNPKELGAVKQAHMTLSKNKEIDLNQRKLLLRTVAASMLSKKQVARA